MAEITFNLDATRANLNYNADLIRSIARIVIDDLPSLVAELQAASAVEDGPRLRQAAHTIRGMSSNFGAQPLMNLASQVEREPFLGSAIDMATAVHAIDEITEETIAKLKQELGM